MKRSWKQMVIGLCALAGGLGIASCSKEASLQSFSGEGQQLQISLRVPANAPTSRYEAGSIYENYIDLVSGNYRIYFFDKDNKFITRFKAAEVLPVEGTNYTEYTLQGEVPEDLLGCTSFKVVMLANWPQYDDEAMIADVTTIDDICNADWAQFAALTDFDNLNPSENRLIPFYGVHKYTGVEFKPNMATILPEPVTLLRAMAKVEVILKTDNEGDTYQNDISFSTVVVHNYNNKGYCAPSGVYTEEGYVDGEGYVIDDLSLHVVGNAKEAKDLSFHKVNQRSDTENEKWIAYLPEYDNSGDDYSYIEVTLDSQTGESAPYQIYFSEYTDDGVRDGESCFNIVRNHLYRFNVRIRNGKLQVNVEDWKNAYDNDYTFE